MRRATRKEREERMRARLCRTRALHRRRKGKEVYNFSKKNGGWAATRAPLIEAATLLDSDGRIILSNLEN